MTFPRCVVIPLIVLAAWTTSGLAHAGGAATKRAPNLLMIITDDQAASTLGAAGDTRGATPNLDAFARQGVTFTNAFCNSPLCTPSRQSLITGLLPHAAGVTRLETPLPANSVTLGTWLKSHGYRTLAIGKMHFQSRLHHGFDTRIDTQDWLDELRLHPPAGGDHRRPWRPFFDPAAEWLNASGLDAGLPLESMESTYFVDRVLEQLANPRDEGGRPFAMVVSFYDPHSPFRFPREWKGRFAAAQFPPPRFFAGDRENQPRVFRELTDDQFRGIQAAYYTSISYVDHEIGRLLRALNERGLDEETLVVFLSDNGYLLGQHGRLEKNCLYEPAVRVPLLMRWPGRLAAGTRFDGLTELLDLVPTICGLLDVPCLPGAQGINLVPALDGVPNAPGRESVFSEYNENEEAMVRSHRYKLVLGSGRRKRLDHLESLRPSRGPHEELYDLRNDPDETTNLAADPRYERIREELVEEMHRRLTSSWPGTDRIPQGLSRRETIHWCLTPRDRGGRPGGS